MNLTNTVGRLADTTHKPRTGIFTLRNSVQHVFRCPGYEFEDVIAKELEPDSLLIEGPPSTHLPFGLRARNWLQRKGVPAGDFTFGAETQSIGQDLDLFFVSPALPGDLVQLNTLSDWRQRSTKAVCYLQELWLAEIDDVVDLFGPILNKFDHVICGFYYSAKALQRKLDVPVSYMPYGVDAELFNPYKLDAKRVIDACAIGNMDTITHDALCDWSGETGRYYHYTTTKVASYSVSHTQHRRNLAQTLQRSKYFFTYLAKKVVTEQRHEQQEFGPRYFEGAAAGAIQLGDSVKSNPAYLANLEWDGAVIDAPYSSSEIPAMIEALEADPERVEDIRKKNVANCLLRHDHLYRWGEVLKVAGLGETPSMAKRQSRLHQLVGELQGNVIPVRRNTGA